jgi:hypothetical protein
MAEQQGPDGSQYRRSFAREVEDDLLERMDKGELKGYWAERPQMRLRADVPSVEVSASTRAQDILDLVAREDGRTVALRSPESGVVAILVPADRYVELAGAAIDGDYAFESIEGRVAVPSPTRLADAGIEQVDPSTKWLLGFKPYPPLQTKPGTSSASP